MENMKSISGYKALPLTANMARNASVSWASSKTSITIGNAAGSCIHLIEQFTITVVFCIH